MPQRICAAHNDLGIRTECDPALLVVQYGRRCLGNGFVDLQQLAWAAGVTASDTAEFNEPDLVALAQAQCARALLHLGHTQDGLSTLDEVMLAVTRREISPLVAGLVYCGMIDCCHGIYAFDRAREWTAALTAWCNR